MLLTLFGAAAFVEARARVSVRGLTTLQAPGAPIAVCAVVTVCIGDRGLSAVVTVCAVQWYPGGLCFTLQVHCPPTHPLPAVTTAMYR